MQKKHRGGFTLVELMVGISIVALLSSVAMYSTAQARAKADDAKKQQEVGQVRVALALHKETTGRVPYNYSCSGTFCSSGSVGVGDSVAPEGSQAYVASMQELVTAGYLSAVPKSKDGSYVYYADATAQRAAFGAPLKSVASASSPTVASSNYCPTIPAPYDDCQLTLGDSNSWTPPTPYYTGSDAVNFYIPAHVPGVPNPATGITQGYIPPESRPESDVQRFCKIYGPPQCFPGGNSIYASNCASFNIPGNPGSGYNCGYPPVNQAINAVLSCRLKTGAVSTCAGAGKDKCACVE